ncbi:MAG: type IV pilus twitching motility protein PilT [Thermoanaerobaculia bacterium]
MEETEDLNRLIAELNAGAEPDSGGTGTEFSEPDPRLQQWLAAVVSRKATDLLLVADLPPVLRRGSSVEFLGSEKLAGEDIERALLPAMSAGRRRDYREKSSADLSVKAEGTRFRVNIHRERGRAAAAIRALPSEAPSLASLGLPPGVEKLSGLPHGLVLVTGPTGSGKTTTLAALVGEINRTVSRHILLIEDPIEYEHTHRKSIVEQIEIGSDSPDFASALRAALRQAPEVIVVGEMRDPETMSIALAAAETGHLVFSTLHTSDAAGAVARIADSFPPERQSTVRQEIAMALAAVLSQQLLPRSDGSGRIAAAELLLVTYGARQHIRKNALQHLHQEIALSRKNGSVSLEESLSSLVARGLVSPEDARSRANHPEEFDSLRR